MSRGPATFKQSDLVRAMKAAKLAGVEIERVEIDRAGKIVIVRASGVVAPRRGTSWDGV